MSAFPDRLRVAITNYAAGAISYKSFALLVDIPYRTLQNYLSGERSPNIDALEKLARNGININWLITGSGSPYLSSEIDSRLLDKIFVTYLTNILEDAFSREKNFYDSDEAFRILSFAMQRDYLGLGTVVRDLIADGKMDSRASAEAAIRQGQLFRLLDKVPENNLELWKALKRVHQARQMQLQIPPFAHESEDDDNVGQ